jgi:hypothetical protein
MKSRGRTGIAVNTNPKYDKLRAHAYCPIMIASRNNPSPNNVHIHTYIYIYIYIYTYVYIYTSVYIYKLCE